MLHTLFFCIGVRNSESHEIIRISIEDGLNTWYGVFIFSGGGLGSKIIFFTALK